MNLAAGGATKRAIAEEIHDAAVHHRFQFHRETQGIEVKRSGERELKLKVNIHMMQSKGKG